MYGNVNYFNVICTIMQERSENYLLSFMLYFISMVVVGVIWYMSCKHFLRAYAQFLTPTAIEAVCFITTFIVLFIVDLNVYIRLVVR